MIFAVGCIAATAVWIGVVGPSSQRDVDLETYQDTVLLMRSGQGYYEAMTEGLRATVGPASTVRAYRLPTVFWVWRTPGMFSWPATFAMLVATSLLVAFASDPLVGIVCLLWLATVAHPVGAEQWAFVEFWALPWVIGAMLAIRAGRYGLACVLAFGVATIRELCVLLLIGGAIAA